MAKQRELPNETYVLIHGDLYFLNVYHLVMHTIRSAFESLFPMNWTLNSCL